jgi:predicted glycosyltransferase
MRWWIDIANAPNVVVFRPIVDRLRSQGDEIVITAWDRGQAPALSIAAWPETRLVGSPGYRSERWAKGTSIALRAVDLARAMRGQRIDVALGHASNAQVMAAKLLRIPSVNMMDYEHHPANHVGFRLADLVFTPAAIPFEALHAFGLSRRRWVPYAYLKEEIALATFEPQPEFRKVLEVAEDDIVAVVRPAAEGAMYHRHRNMLCDEITDRLGHEGCTVLLTPRTASQGNQFEGRRGVRVLREPVSGLDLLYNADLFVGAGGSMTREAAVLGTPAYSIFQGKPASVDRWLEDRGRLTTLVSAEDLPIPTERRPEGSDNLQSRSAAALDGFMSLLETRVRPLVG